MCMGLCTQTFYVREPIYFDQKHERRDLVDRLGRACRNTSVSMLCECSILLKLRSGHTGHPSTPGCFVWPKLKSSFNFNAFTRGLFLQWFAFDIIQKMVQYRNTRDIMRMNYTIPVLNLGPPQHDYHTGNKVPHFFQEFCTPNRGYSS